MGHAVGGESVEAEVGDLFLVAMIVFGADAASVIAALPLPEGAQSVERTTSSAGSAPNLRFTFVSQAESDFVHSFYESHFRREGWRGCSGGSTGTWNSAADAGQNPPRPFRARSLFWLSPDGETLVAVTALVWTDATREGRKGEMQEIKIGAMGPGENVHVLIREYGLSCGP